jgi:serine/threonine protein phosphatase 1
MRTFVIGDIHGQLLPLDKLISWLVTNTKPEDEVVFLGDYIDRGNQTKECLDRVIQFLKSSRCKVITLLGNHESGLLESLRNFYKHTWILGMGGLRTLDCYCPPAAVEMRAELDRLGPDIFTGAHSLPYDRVAQSMPSGHLHFLEQLKPFHRNRHGFYSHAGVNPWLTLENQAEKDLVWGDGDFPALYQGVELVVYGHWNDAYIVSGSDLNLKRQTNAIGIDTIAYGVLTCLSLPDWKITLFR